MLIINSTRKAGRPRKNPAPVEQVCASVPRREKTKTVDKKSAIWTYLQGELARHTEATARQAEDRALRQAVQFGTATGRCYGCGCHLSPDETYRDNGKEYCHECIEPEEISF